MSNPPLLIALCGAPESGKSTVQRIIETQFGVAPFDDGDILRRFFAELIGVDIEKTRTQEGKSELFPYDTGEETIRWGLGELGRILENSYGDQVIAKWAVRAALARSAASVFAPDAYSFGSVRKSQVWHYREMGGVVVEVVRPGAASSYAFDLYDPEAVDHTIVNDGDLSALFERVLREFPDVMRLARERRLRRALGAGPLGTQHQQEEAA